MQSRGMTLLEVIIVIAILGILTAICIPKNTMRKHNLHSQAKLLTNEIRMVRYTTMTEGKSLAISLNRHDYKVFEGSKHIKTVELGEGIRLGNNINQMRRIRFNTNGSPRDAGSLRLRDTVTMEYYDISIVPFTGRILLKEVNY